MSHVAITFDTLAFAKKMEASGLQAKQAESIAEGVRDIFEENLSNTVFTKEDGKSLRAEFKAEMKLLATELRADIAKLELKFQSAMAKLKSEIIIWVVGLLFAQTAILVSIIKFIH